MNVYRRYFIVSTGLIADKAREVIETNIEARKKYKEILDDIGADHRYYAAGDKLTGVMLPDDMDKSIFKKVNGEAWYPKQNSKAGKALHKRFDSVAVMEDRDVLSVLGEDGRSPEIFTGGSVYFSSAIIIPSDPATVIVYIPWFDEDPEAIEKHRKEKSNIRGGNMDSLLWTPVDGMTEVKEWEVKKLIDEWNSRNKK